MKTDIVIFVDNAVALPENKQWQFRFEIKSESSDRVYIIAQHKTKLHWACSCFGWRRFRKCKHLTAIGLPNHEVPYEAKIETS